MGQIAHTPHLAHLVVKRIRTIFKVFTIKPGVNFSAVASYILNVVRHSYYVLSSQAFDFDYFEQKM